MKFLSVVPEDVRSLFDGGHFNAPDDPFARAAAELLVTDERMRKPWVALLEIADPEYTDEYGSWAQSFIGNVAYHFSDARRNRRRWHNMTSIEQQEWREKFLFTVRQLVALLKSGPWPPALSQRLILAADYDERQKQARAYQAKFALGVDVDLEDAMNVLDDTNFEVPLDDIAVYRLEHLLAALAEDQLAFADSLQQSLKKPRDAHAGRARFLQELTKWTISTCGAKLQEVVATTAAVVFRDDAINVRLVQRHTQGL